MFFKIGSIDPSSAHFEAWLAMDGNVPEAARVPRAGAAAAAAPLSTSPQPPLLHTSQSGEDDAFPLIHPAFWQQCLVHRAPHPAAGALAQTNVLPGALDGHLHMVGMLKS